jgi:alpha-D-xyloside xylohydrolase
LEEVYGKGKAIVFARSATVGGQKFPVHWGGDCTATFESMAESLRGGLSLSLSGFGFWSHDMGGFEQTAPPAVYKRWCAFGLLSSHSRLHGSGSYRVPWHFDDEAVDVLRFFTRLKCRLMPYLYRAACQAHQQGLPMMRPMLVEFPDDPACETLERQYMLGDALLVAPVMDHDNTVAYYVPAGKWTNLITGQVVEGPGWQKEKHGFLSLPLLVRPNSIIAMGGNDERPDYDYANGVTLQVYQLEPGKTVTVEIPDQHGQVESVFTVSRRENTMLVERKGSAKAWQVLLVGEHAARSQAEMQDTPAGILFSLQANDPSQEINELNPPSL